jgi:hypothetical protein
MQFEHEINNECAFDIKSNNGICSPKPIINKLQEFVVNFNMSKPNISPQDTIKLLKKKYDCKTESCVINNYNIKNFISPDAVNKVLENNFKPKGPRNTFDWLSNHDIDDVLDQIEKKYTDKYFYHIDFQMRDFEKTNSELSNFNFKEKFDQGYRTFGTVVNTDYSDGNGIHWFAIFGDFLDNNKCYTIEYFNSSGEPPLDEINIWMKKIKHKWNEIFDKPVNDIIVTKLQHQNDNHSCGAYSLYYIISRLDGISYKYFRENHVPDEIMHKFRKYLFRDES